MGSHLRLTACPCHPAGRRAAQNVPAQMGHWRGAAPGGPSPPGTASVCVCRMQTPCCHPRRRGPAPRRTTLRPLGRPGAVLGAGLLLAGAPHLRAAAAAPFGPAAARTPQAAAWACPAAHGPQVPGARHMTPGGGGHQLPAEECPAEKAGLAGAAAAASFAAVAAAEGAFAAAAERPAALGHVHLPQAAARVYRLAVPAHTYIRIRPTV